VYKVASQAGVIHPQNQGLHPRSRPAGDAQQLASPFSQLLDDAGAAPSLPPKDVSDRSQTVQTGQPQAPGDQQQQAPQAPPGSEPPQQVAVVAPVQLLDVAEIDKTTAEATAAPPLDDHSTDTAKAPEEPPAAMAIALANATQPAAEPQVPAVVIAPMVPVETQPIAEQPASSIFRTRARRRKYSPSHSGA
jgi:hypothetical protein